MKPLSLDLRARIIAAYEAGEGSYEVPAERFSVGPTGVGKLVRQKRDLGTLESQAHRRGLQAAGFCAASCDLVVMGNLSSHKSVRAIAAIESVGAQVVYLPSYSPDLNPIENIFSKAKQFDPRASPAKFRQDH